MSTPSVVEQNADYKTLAAFPIIRDETMYGVVSIYSSTLEAYTPSHQRLMREATSLLASALSAVSEGAGWEKQLLPVTENRDSQTALSEWVPDYEITH